MINLFPIGLKYAGVMNVDNIYQIGSYLEFYEKLLNYIKVRQNLNLTGGSSIVIENMNTFSQMVTYLYRPIPFEAHNLTSFFSSIDNVILIILTISSSFLIFNKKIQGPSYIFLISIFVCNLFILSKTTANLGIAVRQKWMILPVLIILLLSLYSQKSNDEKN